MSIHVRKHYQNNGTYPPAMLGTWGSSELTGTADKRDGSDRAAGADKMQFFLQRDSHSVGCTRQMPPNRVSADSPSRILPGDVLVSLRIPPPKKLERCKWPGGNSRIYFRESVYGLIKN
jgi:hypothetical protein